MDDKIFNANSVAEETANKLIKTIEDYYAKNEMELKPTEKMNQLLYSLGMVAIHIAEKTVHEVHDSLPKKDLLDHLQLLLVKVGSGAMICANETYDLLQAKKENDVH